MPLLKPKHTLESVLNELREGLEDGSIMVQPKAKMRLPKESPGVGQRKVQTRSSIRPVLFSLTSTLLAASLLWLILRSQDPGPILLSALLALIAALLAQAGYTWRLRQRTLELEELTSVRTAELVKANAAKDEFLAGISHEIRNPINGIIGLATALEQPQAPSGVNHDRVRQLRMCATHLAGLLEDILDFSRTQAGAVTINSQVLDVHDLVESVVAITSAESARTGLPVEVRIARAVPARVVGDPARIRQIILNFVINALRYAGRGRVIIAVTAKPVDSEISEVIFAVEDEGPGISVEDQQRLFTRFERGAAAKATNVAGIGLGLAICRLLAEKMGGRLWVESELGRGSRFVFAVPLAVEQASETVPLEESVKVQRALVVEDEEYNRIALEGILEPLGYVTDGFERGRDGLAAASKRRYDVVFLDLALGDTTGIEVARELRSRLKYDGPIIATTAYSTQEKRAQCVDVGMDAFLSKPLSLGKVRRALAIVDGPQTR